VTIPPDLALQAGDHLDEPCSVVPCPTCDAVLVPCQATLARLLRRQNWSVMSSRYGMGHAVDP
jgi:hypothetical protein